MHHRTVTAQVAHARRAGTVRACAATAAPNSATFTRTEAFPAEPG
jgi:hypothetical protein